MTAEKDPIQAYEALVNDGEIRVDQNQKKSH